jgi:hypothetical protein
MVGDVKMGGAPAQSVHAEDMVRDGISLWETVVVKTGNGWFGVGVLATTR